MPWMGPSRKAARLAFSSRILPVAVLRSLNHRPFALLWSGQAVSRLGDSVYRIALAWWILEATGSPTVMGAVFVLSTAPMLLFLILGGMIVDRAPRLAVMLVSDLLRGLLVGVVSVMAYHGSLQLWHVYVASAAFGIVEAFFQPAYVAAIPEITPTDALTSANSLTALANQLVGVLGPALGSWLVSAAGTPAAFLLDSISFGVSALCLFPLIRTATAHAAMPGRAGILKSLGEGIGAVVQSPWLWITIVLAAIGNVTLAGPRIVALPFLVKESFQADVRVLGVLYSSASVGAVIAVTWLGRLSRIRRRGAFAYGALFCSGISLILMGLSPDFLVIVIAAVALGGSVAIFGLIWTNTLQSLVPRQLLGRVSSIDYFGSFAMLPIGLAITGWATDLVGAKLVFILGGLSTSGLAILGLAHPAIRKVD